MANRNSTPAARITDGAYVLALAGAVHTLPAALVGRLLAGDAGAVVTECGRQFLDLPEDLDGCMLPAGALAGVLAALRAAGGDLEAPADGPRVVVARDCEGRDVVVFLEAEPAADLVTLDRVSLERLRAQCEAAVVALAH